MKLIDKDALVAKIDDWRHNIMTGIATLHGRQRVDAAFEHEILGIVRDFLDTLEVKELPIWEKVSPDTGQTTLYKDGGKSYLERFGYRIDLKDLDKLPKKNLKALKGK